MNQKAIIINFINQIWNRKETNSLADFVSPDYKDHSLPKGLPPNIDGLAQWIKMTTSAFDHHTSILHILCEENTVFVHIKLSLVHIGPWRGYARTNSAIETTGYRLFKFSDGKISEQWALLDADKIVEAITGTINRCTILQ